MKKNLCYKDECNNLIHEGGLCKKHLEEFEADELQQKSEIQAEQEAADYLYGVKD